VLALGTAVGSSGLAAGGTAGALLGAELAGTDSAAGIPLGLLVVGSAGAAPLISVATSRLGRARSLALGYLVGAAGAGGVVLAAIAESLVVLLVASVLLGAANASVFLTRYAAADSVHGDVRGRALGAVFFATAVGAVASPLLLGPSGDVAEAVGLPRLSGLYGIAVIAFTAAALILTAFASRIATRPSTDDVGEVESSPVTRSELAIGLRAAPTQTALLILGASNFVMVAVMAVAPVHLTDHGHSLAFVGVVISMHVAGMFAPSPISGWLTDRLGPIPVAGLGMLLLVSAGISGALVNQHSGIAISVTLVVLGVGWNFGIVAGSTLLSAGATPRLRPHTEGIGEVAMGAAAGLGAPAAGLLVGAGGFASLWLAAAAVAIGSALYVRRFPQPVIASRQSSTP
jgi:MFS family permease